MGLESEIKNYGTVSSPNGKPSTDKVYFAKQNIKNDDNT